jgi:hypothetical protein
VVTLRHGSSSTAPSRRPRATNQRASVRRSFLPLGIMAGSRYGTGRPSVLRCRRRPCAGKVLPVAQSPHPVELRDAAEPIRGANATGHLAGKLGHGSPFGHRRAAGDRHAIRRSHGRRPDRVVLHIPADSRQGPRPGQGHPSTRRPARPSPAQRCSDAVPRRSPTARPLDRNVLDRPPAAAGTGVRRGDRHREGA